MIGKIYKVVHAQSDAVYVGSTFDTLRGRFSKHRTGTSEIGKLMRRLDADTNNFKIVLIKEYDVCDRKHLNMYEQLWINKLTCINKYNTLRIPWIINHIRENTTWHCDVCNSSTMIKGKARHIKTAKHQKHLRST